MRILGPVEAWSEGRQVDVGGPRQVRLLACLVIHTGQAVSSDQLVEWLWPEQPSGSRKRLQMAVARLRQSLAPLMTPGGLSLATVDGGYLLGVSADALDAAIFERGVRDGQRALNAGDPTQASQLLSSALVLWRGPPLAQVSFQDFSQPEIRRLTEMRLAALEARIDADLRLGRHDGLIDELFVLGLAHPDRERLTGQLMLALYRCGRQTDALQAYERTRSHLATELGLQPGPALARLQDDILNHRAALAAGTSLAAETGGLAGTTAPVRAHRTLGEFSAPPTAATPTVGRQREIPQIAKLLAQAEVRIVTLTGPGGVGKTRIAGVVARELLSVFEDGVWWVELAGVARAQDVGSAVAHGLGVTSLPGETATEAMCRSIGDRHVLLVVDNFEHVLEAADVLAALVAACPALTVLTTSREALNLSAEHRFHVLPLSVLAQSPSTGLVESEVSDAGALFIAAARRRDHRFRLDPQAGPTLARVCAQLDGLPLALELAAARTPYLTLDALAAGLDSSMKESGGARRDAPPRHHTVEATVDWSYRLLDREQRHAFVGFAVFAGGATFDDAIDVTATDRGKLEALVDKSLLHQRRLPDGAIRLAMLETIRAHAGRRLDCDPDRDAIRERHLSMALELVLRECPRLRTHGDRDALKALDAEIDNIRAALDWAIEAMPSSALKLVGHLAEYWRIRIDFGGLSWLNAALEAVGDSAASPDHARAVLHQALQLGFRDQGDASLAGLNRALSLFRETDDQFGAAETLCCLASGVGVFADDGEAEREYAEQALGEAQLVGDDALIGRALARLAPCLAGDEREVTLRRAAELLDRVGDYREIAMAYNNAAYQTLREEQPERADGLLAPALTAAQRAGDAWNLIVIHGTAGLTKVVLGHHDEAREHVRLQLELSLEHGLRHNGEGVIGLAAIQARRGGYDAAARLSGVARGLGYPPTKHDVTIDERLERDFLAPAMRAYGEGRWRHAERAGAAMPYPEAIAYALGETTSADGGAPLGGADQAPRADPQPTTSSRHS